MTEPLQIDRDRITHVWTDQGWMGVDDAPLEYIEAALNDERAALDAAEAKVSRARRRYDSMLMIAERRRAER